MRKSTSSAGPPANGKRDSTEFEAIKREVLALPVVEENRRPLPRRRARPHLHRPRRVISRSIREASFALKYPGQLGRKR